MYLTGKDEGKQNNKSDQSNFHPLTFPSTYSYKSNIKSTFLFYTWCYAEIVPKIFQQSGFKSAAGFSFTAEMCVISVREKQ